MTLSDPHDTQWRVVEAGDGRVTLARCETRPVRRLELRISLGAIAAIVLLLCCLPFSLREASAATTEHDGIISRWEDTGFLFPDSGSRYLTEADLRELEEASGAQTPQLLRFAVNEIYARHGYRFSMWEYFNFYSSFDWYQGQRSDVEAVKNFNPIENANLAFLVNAEKQAMGG